MTVHPDELRAINDRILEGEERITHQRERVTVLEKEGQDAAAAREMLQILENSQMLLISRRNLLLRQG